MNWRNSATDNRSVSALLAPAKKGLIEALVAMDRQDEAVSYLEILAENGDAEAAQMLNQIKSNNN